VKAGRDELIRVQAKALGQRQGPDPGDLRIRGLAQKLAEPVNHDRFDLELDKPVEPMLEPRPA
jgi:hypothetical protein